jgi:hypothetical protein
MNADTATPATETQPRGISQAAIFAVEYAKNAAREMLTTLADINRNSSWIVKLALGGSMPHQIGYILSLTKPFLHWDSLFAWPESIALIALAFIVPIATDLYILNCIKNVGARAAANSSKIYAMVTMLSPIGVSGWVNFVAPGPVLMKYLAAWCVVLIPLAEGGRALLKADFAKIEKMETDATSQLTRTAERLTERMKEEMQAPTETGPDMKQINRQRQLAAQKARELAAQAPDISIVALTRATGCGRGAAKKAIELAKATAQVDETVAV